MMEYPLNHFLSAVFSFSVRSFPLKRHKAEKVSVQMPEDLSIIRTKDSAILYLFTANVCLGVCFST